MSLVDELYSKYLRPQKTIETNIIDRRDTRIFLKQEFVYNSGDILLNIKRKPAYYLFHDLYNKGIIKDGMKLISASSGNFVLNLGIKANEYGLKLIAVTPPRIPEENVKALTSLGVDVIHITEEFDMCPRETTVFYTRSLAESYRYILVNVDQYISWQNVLSHFFLTWNEIKSEFEQIDYIIIALGSTGTYMGVSLGNKVDRLAKEVIGVQPPHEHNIPGVHHIVDGCEWNPEIFSPSIGGYIITVDDVDTYRWLAILENKGIHVGPSTAMLYAAVERLSRERPGDYLIVSPDSDRLYRNHLLRIYSKLYNDIVSRYPEDREIIDRFIRDLRGREDIDIPEYIKRYYKPREEGRVYEISKLDRDYISKILSS